METAPLAAIALAIVAFAAISGRVERSPLTPPIFFVAVVALSTLLGGSRRIRSRGATAVSVLAWRGIDIPSTSPPWRPRIVELDARVCSTGEAVDEHTHLVGEELTRAGR